MSGRRFVFKAISYFWSEEILATTRDVLSPEIFFHKDTADGFFVTRKESAADGSWQQRVELFYFTFHTF
jgi:hypothetical protein